MGYSWDNQYAQLVTISPHDSRPTYVQVAEILKAEIMSGGLHPGQRLPSVRELSERYGIAPATTANALRLLRDEGWVFSSSTRGYYVSDEPPDTLIDNVNESPSYRLITEQLDAMRRELHDLASRVAGIEVQLRTGQPSPGPSGLEPR